MDEQIIHVRRLGQHWHVLSGDGHAKPFATQAAALRAAFMLAEGSCKAGVEVRLRNESGSGVSLVAVPAYTP